MSSPRLPDWRWVLLLVIGSLVVLWLALGTPKAHGQTNSSDSLTESEELLEQLVRRLQERQAQVEQLQKDLRAISLSHDVLLKQYGELDKSWTDYRTEVLDQMGRLECTVKAWRWVAIGTSIAALIATIVAIGK